MATGRAALSLVSTSNEKELDVLIATVQRSAAAERAKTIRAHAARAVVVFLSALVSELGARNRRVRSAPGHQVKASQVRFVPAYPVHTSHPSHPLLRLAAPASCRAV